MADETQVVDSPESKEIIAPGHTFGTITDQIASVVLTKKTPYVVMGTFAVAMGLLLLFLLAVGLLFTKGLGVWGLRGPTMWAWDITNFVWWVGIGHADFRHSAAAQPAVAQFHQSLRRSHDHLRGGLRGHVPDSPPGPPLADVLALPVSQHHGNRAQLPQPAGVGCVRGIDVRHGVGALLVCGPDARSGHAARPHRASRAESGLRHSGDGVARLGQALVGLRNRFPAAGRVGDAAGALGTHRGQPGLHRRHRPRLAQYLLPALLRGGRDLFRLRHGAGPGHPVALRLRAERA